MHIGFDAKRLFCNSTGLGNYSRTIVRNLQNYAPEHDYHLYSPSIGSYGQEFSPGQFHIHTPFLGSALWRSFGIRRNLIKDNIALFHGLSNELPFALPAKIKKVVTIHDLIFKVLPDTYSLLNRKIYDFKFKQACLGADIIIAISENTKKDIIHYYGVPSSRIQVLYQACLPEFYEEEYDKIGSAVLHLNLPQEYILAVGSGSRKNLKQLIEAHQQLPHYLQLPIVIVGKMDKQLYQYANTLVKRGLLLWLDDIKSTICLREIYQKATVLVYPSLYEGFGLPIVEALLSNTPVIAADSAAIREAGGEDTLYFNPTQTDDLAAVLKLVLSDDDLRQKIAYKGYNYAFTKFHPQTLTEQLLDIYSSI